MGESQTRANKAWRKKNRSRSNYLIKRSTAKSFIRSVGTDEDIVELNDLMTERLKTLGSNSTDVVESDAKIDTEEK